MKTASIALLLGVESEAVTDAMRVPMKYGIVEIRRCLDDKRVSIYSLAKQRAEFDPFANDRSGRMRQLIVSARKRRARPVEAQHWASVIFNQKVVQ